MQLFELQAELATFVRVYTTFTVKNNRQTTMVVHIWVYGRQFLKNEKNKLKENN